MNGFIRILLLTLLILPACKSKKTDMPATNFFPAPTYIRGELKRLDTARLSFLKIETTDGRSDTTPLKNSEIRQYAKEFLDLPDIASSDLKDDYTVSQLYDDMQGAFVFRFATKESHPLREENITVDPAVNADGRNNIKSIYAKIEGDSASLPFTKILFWEAGKGFYTTTVSDPPGKSEQVRKVQVIRNGFDSQMQ